MSSEGPKDTVPSIKKTDTSCINVVDFNTLFVPSYNEDKKGIDQEPKQFNSTSSQDTKGERKPNNLDSIKQNIISGKLRGQFFPSRWPPVYSKHDE